MVSGVRCSLGADHPIKFLFAEEKRDVTKQELEPELPADLTLNGYAA